MYEFTKTLNLCNSIKLVPFVIVLALKFNTQLKQSEEVGPHV